MFIQFLLNGLITGLLYAVASLGFSLVYNTTRIFHVAYAAIYVSAGYFFYTFTNLLHLPVWLSFILSVTSTALLGVFVEIAVYKPLEIKKTSSNLIMISSIGILIILTNLIALLYGNETKVITNQISSSIEFGELLLTYNQLIQAGVCILCLLLILYFLKNTRLGLQTRAIRDDAALSQIFGINLYGVRVIIFGLSGALAAVVSCLIAYDVGMDPYVGMPLLLNAMVALIVGGIGRFETPILGGLILGILQSVAVYFFESRWENAITFSLLLIFLIFRPQGILGEKTRAV